MIEFNKDRWKKLGPGPGDDDEIWTTPFRKGVLVAVVQVTNVTGAHGESEEVRKATSVTFAP